MSILSSIKKVYTSIDKSVGGYLPGGVPPAKKETSPSTNVVPQKSTTINIQPKVPNMNATTSSGQKITNTNIPTQSPSQFTPSKSSTSSGSSSRPSGSVGSSASNNSAPVDASFTQGTSVYNPATNILESNKIQDTKPNNVVTSVQRPSGLAGYSYDISNQRNKLSTQYARNQINPFLYNAESFGLGFGSIVVGTAQSIIHPINAAKGTYGTVAGAVSSPRTFFGNIGTTIRNEPGYSTGVIVGFYATGKATDFAVKKTVYTGVDIYRTRGLSEVSKESTIAPEFFKGQKYPQISRGEKAGGLLKEFSSQGYGFTSSPKPINPSKGVMAGSSELPGLYQAPKVSPTFLRVSGETKKAFSLNPFGTLRPTVSKITPSNFELAEGIRPSSSFNSGNTGRLKDFFSERATLGKSYVPFIKSEKEAIIPVGTALEKTGAKSFFKFEGRRIPIQEFNTLKGESKITKGTVSSLNEVSSYSGYSSIGSKSYINPINLVPFAGVSSSSGRSSSSYKPTKSSYNSPSYSNSLSSYSPSSYIKSSVSNYKYPSIPSYPSPPSPSGSGSSSDYFSKPSYTSYPSSSSSSNVSYFKPIITSSVLPLSRDLSSDLRTRIYKGKQRKKYTPSYQALIFNVKGKQPRSQAGFRPITKGFSWNFNNSKLPRMRL